MAQLCSCGFTLQRTRCWWASSSEGQPREHGHGCPAPGRASHAGVCPFHIAFRDHFAAGNSRTLLGYWKVPLEPFGWAKRLFVPRCGSITCLFHRSRLKATLWFLPWARRGVGPELLPRSPQDPWEMSSKCHCSPRAPAAFPPVEEGVTAVLPPGPGFWPRQPTNPLPEGQTTSFFMVQN